MVMSKIQATLDKLIEKGTLQAEQDALALSINSAIVLSDATGRLLTEPSFPEDFRKKYSKALLSSSGTMNIGTPSLRGRGA